MRQRNLQNHFSVQGSKERLNNNVQSCFAVLPYYFQGTQITMVILDTVAPARQATAVRVSMEAVILLDMVVIMGQTTMEQVTLEADMEQTTTIAHMVLAMVLGMGRATGLDTAQQATMADQ